MSGFQLKHPNGGSDAFIKMVLKNSSTVAKGDLLEFASGKLQRCNAQADLPLYVAQEDKTSTSTEDAEILVLPILPMLHIFEIDFTPLVNNEDVESGSTTTAVFDMSAGTDTDLIGGLIRVRQLNETRIITGNTYGSGNCTVTVEKPFSRATAVGDYVDVVPFGPGTRALKLGSSNPHKTIATAIADITGGKVVIHKVDMARKVAEVKFLAS